MITQVLQVPWKVQRWATKNKLNSFEASGWAESWSGQSGWSGWSGKGCKAVSDSLDSFGEVVKAYIFSHSKFVSKRFISLMHLHRELEICARPSRCCAVESLPGASSGNQAKHGKAFSKAFRNVQHFLVQYGSILLESGLHIVAYCGA
jgi:hypothetical protein